MFMCLKRAWQALDVKGQKLIVIPAGWYEIESVPNPYRPRGRWLMVKGTLCGASELYWRQGIHDAETDQTDSEVLITDDLPAGAVLVGANQIMPYTKPDGFDRAYMFGD
jgi:hypothetical protein